MPQPSTGQLDQRITFESRTQGKDAEGGLVDNWLSLKTVWAKRNNLSGNVKSITGAGGEAREARTEFTTRYHPTLENDQLRIVHKGKVFQVTHVNNYMESNTWLIFSCNTGVSSGR